MQNDKMDAKAERQEFAKRQEFECLVRENQSGLLAFLLSLTGNIPDSEDLVQECTTLLWSKFDEFESGSNFGAWARTTAFFLFRNQCRKASNKTMIFEANVLEKLAMAHNRIETEGSTRQHFLSECLAELGEKDRELILSRYETGNYWFYIPNIGWLWSGPDFYGNAEGHTFLYSNDLQSWLHYQTETNNFHVYQGTGYLINHAGITSASVDPTTSDAKGGTVTGSGIYSISTSHALTAEVNPGYRFTGWTDSEGNSLGTNITLEVNVSGDIAITATFIKQTESEILGGIFD
jgi:RNA polymerase sigma-70 factor (ECF subfamily)